MRDPGPIEDAPLRFGNGALLADRQRDDDSGIRRVGKRRENARPEGLARRSTKSVTRPANASSRRLRPFGAHVPRSAELVLEEPGFDVEAVRVHRSVRPLQADDELPTFSGRDRGDSIRGAAFPDLRIPGERQPAGNDRARGERALDRERETRAALRGLRQVVDDTDDRDILALPFRRQRVSQAHFSAGRRVAEAEREGRQDGEGPGNATGRCTTGNDLHSDGTCRDQGGCE